jgi:hypothetical protein
MNRTKFAGDHLVYRVNNPARGDQPGSIAERPVLGPQTSFLGIAKQEFGNDEREAGIAER